MSYHLPPKGTPPTKRQARLFNEQIWLSTSLSKRNKNAIWRFGLYTKMQVLCAYQHRELHPSNPKATGFGRKALAEVRAWLGLRPELTGQQIFELRCKAVLFLQDQMDGNQTKFADLGRIMRMSKVQAERHWRRGLHNRIEQKRVIDGYYKANEKNKPVRCGQCSQPVVKESDAEGYSCPSCGAADSDE